MAETKSIKSFTPNEVSAVMEELGQPKYRAKQLYEWLHSHNASSYDEMTNLPKTLRRQLEEIYPFGGITVLEVQRSQDGSRKYLLKLADGETVETVGILDGENEGSDKQHDGSEAISRDPDAKRLTVCCSTQIGCAMNCAFCATGKQGLSRNLSSEEIVDQVTTVANDFGQRVSNVVLMGQGEPFQNYDESISAMRRMNSDEGIGIGARHITVSTSGIVEGINRFLEEAEQFRLAVSLHSAVQETRNRLMPRLSNQPLDQLKDAILNYSLAKGRRTTLEYMLLDGVNDLDSELDALIEFCEGINVHVNILPFNAINGASFHPSSRKTVQKWANVLSKHGIPNSVRKSKGSDIAGACGQLKENTISCG